MAGAIGRTGQMIGRPNASTRPGVEGHPAWLLADDEGAPPLLQASPGRYWFDGAVYPAFAAWSAAVGSVSLAVSAHGTRRDAAGRRVRATAEGGPRVDHDDLGQVRGWLVEGAGDNHFLHSEHPAAQTVAWPSNRTNIWMEGTGSIEVSGPAEATVTEDSPLYYDLSGDVTLTPAGEVGRVQVEKNNANRTPSSYIPTEGSPVTRAADVFHIGPDEDGRPFRGFDRSAGTLVVQGRTGDHFNIVDQTLIQLDNGSSSDVMKLYRSEGGSGAALKLRAGGIEQAALQFGGFGDGRPFALAATYAVDEVSLCIDGASAATETPAMAPEVTRITLGESLGGDHWAGHVSLIAYWPRRMLDLAQRNFYLATPDRVHGLGDSSMSAHFDSALQARLGARVHTSDCVGGSSLAEQLARWTATPAFHDQILILADDMTPLSDSLEDLALMLATYRGILDRLRGGRFLILEPGFPQGGEPGSPRIVERRNKWSAVAAAYPDNAVTVSAAMQAASDGSDLDAAYVAAGLWPGSCLVAPGSGPDATIDGHLNAKGADLYARCAHDALRTRGWI